MARCARGRSGDPRRPVPASRRKVWVRNMDRAMIARICMPHARVRACVRIACALTALAGILAAETSAAGTTSQRPLGISIPASARIHGTTPTSTTPASARTTPPAATVTPPAGAQPGTVAPSTATPTTPTAPATIVPPTTGTPGSTVPGARRIAPAGGSSTMVGVGRRASARHTHLSTAALALLVLGAVLLLGCLAWVAGRWFALEPRWTVSFMHSLREASYRASATWAEFSDWARLGH